MSVSVQAGDFDVAAELAALQAAADQVAPSACGAVVSFTGLVRGDDGLLGMTLEHYPGMAERQLKSLEEEARRRWKILDVRIVHRYGCLQPGDRIVLVAVAASHRGDAFAAGEFLMDWLKTQAPFWKEEIWPEQRRWVAARAGDEAAAARHLPPG